jgi:hypothetical protein
MATAYENPRAPASFSGIDKFRQNNKRVPFKHIKKLNAYILFKPAPRRFVRCVTTVNSVNDEWQADLVDITNLRLSDHFIVTVIDVFSRFAFAELLPNKTKYETAKAFKKIFRNYRPPKVLYTDQGKEFFSEDVFNQHNVTHILSTATNKAAIVERFNRTLRQKIVRYSVHANTKDFRPVLQDLIYSYNNTIHPFHGYTPSDVYKMSEPQQLNLRKKIYNEISEDDMTLVDLKNKTVLFKFKLGDTVRLAANKGIFDKATTFQKWLPDIYTIDQLCPTLPPTYKIRSEKGNLMDRRYYKEELQRVDKPTQIIKPTNIEQKRVEMEPESLIQPRRSPRNHPLPKTKPSKKPQTNNREENQDKHPQLRRSPRNHPAPQPKPTKIGKSGKHPK